MKHQYKLILWIFIASLFITVSAKGEDKFKLRPGASGKLCFSCHVNFQEKIKNPFIHAPVKSGKCTDCHNPHSSKYPKMLSMEISEICFSCHSKLIPDKPRSVHNIFVKGMCLLCHDSHGSLNKFNLVRPGNELCFKCHQDIASKVRARFKHNPVEKGCLSCHNAHVSRNEEKLLKEDDPKLCMKCHQTGKASFLKQHINYPVTKGRCTSCHDVHGSEKAPLLYSNVHTPVASRMCNQCHNDPASADAIKTKKKGYELCRGCHSKLINNIFGKTMIHWPIFGKDGCLNCHRAHASTEKALLKEKAGNLCGRCHSDTMGKLERSLVKHEPIKNGNCIICHTPHAANGSYLLTQPSIIEVCAMCHRWQSHTTHPIGEKAIDQRNKNLRVDCLSCHRSHGTPFKRMFYMESQIDLCTQCHVEYKR